MSEPVKPLVLSATEVDARAAAWLIKQREHEGWSEADQAALDSWLAESWAHSAAYWRVKAAWNYADRLNMVPRPLANSRLADVARRMFPASLKIAAGLALVAALGTGALLLTPQQPKERTYATLVGGRETLAFTEARRSNSTPIPLSARA